MPKEERRYQSLNARAVRRAKQMDRKPAVHGQHRLAVREGPESLWSTPASNARVSAPAEGQIALEHMPCPIVDRHAARVDVACQPSYFACIATEVIQRERTRPGRDVSNGFVQ